MAHVGRNAPCACGSGKKYKKCHGLVTEAMPMRPPASPTESLATRPRVSPDSGRHNDIRATLATTKAATFSLELPNEQRNGMSVPTGTGFFVSPDGFFLTAAHVVAGSDGAPREDLDRGCLIKEPVLSDHYWGSNLCQWPSIDFFDGDLDLAILKIDFGRNANKDWLQGKTAFPYLHISARPLDEGESVYAYGYPLSTSDVLLIEVGTIGLIRVGPRVTSAIVSATRESYGPVITSGDPVRYVLDKALNYGNSGGPIIATETGHVHALCSSFQPVYVPQSHLKDADGASFSVKVPSLYGVVTSLANPAFVKELQRRGVEITTD